MGHALEDAREAYARFGWDDAYVLYRTAAEREPLEGRDLAAFADAAWWLGRNDEALTLSEAVYRRHLHGERVPESAWLAIEIGCRWLMRGEPTVGSGWISRARRLLEDAPECLAHGYLRYLEVEEALGGGRFQEAIEGCRAIQGIADRHDDPTLHAVGLMLEGAADVRRGRVEAGLALIDEAMLPVRAGDVLPDWSGNLYCHVMELCFELADLERARAWTAATEDWCDQHSSAAMFSGICRLHRAQLLCLEGAWGDAEERAAQTCRDLAELNVGVVAAAQYQIGELRRLRGDHAGAEEAFTAAHQLGRDPQPGLALLRLAQGRCEAAASALRAALAGVPRALDRVPLLAAQVEVAAACGDSPAATRTAQELAEIAGMFGTPGLLATASQACGLDRLTAGEADEALPALRDARRRWQELDACYEAARMRTRIAAALTALGDVETADREAALARAVFSELGAADDLRSLDVLQGQGGRPLGLSTRELEVLRCVCAGDTNRQIATALTISEKTVARHLSNIFTKLGVASRTEAAAVAFRRGVAEGRTP